MLKISVSRLGLPSRVTGTRQELRNDASLPIDEAHRFAHPASAFIQFNEQPVYSRRNHHSFAPTSRPVSKKFMCVVKVAGVKAAPVVKHFGVKFVKPVVGPALPCTRLPCGQASRRNLQGREGVVATPAIPLGRFAALPPTGIRVIPVASIEPNALASAWLMTTTL